MSTQSIKVELHGPAPEQKRGGMPDFIKEARERTIRLLARDGYTVFDKDELAILSKLLRGYVVGPAARKVLAKVHGE